MFSKKVYFSEIGKVHFFGNFAEVVAATHLKTCVVQLDISQKGQFSDFGKVHFFGNFAPCFHVKYCMRRDEPTNLSRERQLSDELDIMARLRDGSLQFPPAHLRLMEFEVPTSVNRRADGILEVTWRERVQRYVVECKNRSTPQTVQLAVSQARLFAYQFGLPPMVIVPYLSDQALDFLQSANVSGVDLSGNGIVLAPDFALWRSGQPNRYPASQLIRNLYRGASAIFVRCLLLRGQFDTLKQLQEYALSRLDVHGAYAEGRIKLSLSTASKVVQQLEEDLLVRREGRGLHVVDAQRLMDGLKTYYRTFEGGRLSGKTYLDVSQIWRRMQEPHDTVRPPTWRYAATGLGSAAKYRVLSGPDKLSLYVTDLDRVADLIGLSATRVFPNVELIETSEDAAYFDARRDGAEVWASPIQTWLELATGGPREQDAALTLASALAESRGEQII